MPVYVLTVIQELLSSIEGELFKNSIHSYIYVLSYSSIIQCLLVIAGPQAIERVCHDLQYYILISLMNSIILLEIYNYFNKILVF